VVLQQSSEAICIIGQFIIGQAATVPASSETPTQTMNTRNI